MGKAGDWVLVGGGRPQLRQPRGRDWTKAKARKFIEALSESCNVTLAAEQAGVSSGSAYRRRAIDAGFRAQWRQALAMAYSRLEMMMLERALHGLEQAAVAGGGGEARPMRDYSDRTALTLLKMHRDTAIESEKEVDPGDHREAMERILARLKRLRARDAVETKGANDVIGLLRWALGRA